MPQELPELDVAAGRAAIEYAQAVRKLHRRRTPVNDKQRLRDIQIAKERLAAAMKPLRSHIGRFPYEPQTSTARANRATIIDLSAQLQSERRKLWKMENR